MEKETDTEKVKLQQMYEEMYRRMISKDTEQLAKLLDDSFVLVHMTGMRQPRQEYLDYIKRGTLNYYSANHQSMVVNLSDNKAELVGQSMVNAAVFGGGRHVWRLQQKIKFVYKSGKWYMTESVASTY